MQLQGLGGAEGSEHRFPRVKESPTGKIQTIKHTASLARSLQDKGSWESVWKQDGGKEGTSP